MNNIAKTMNKPMKTDENIAKTMKNH